MLAIRMQRTGRTGHAQFRVIVQDSHFSPTRGRVVAYVGSYNPHTKDATLDADKISAYLDKGAQPSDTVARLLKKEGVKLPKWVQLAAPKKRQIKNLEKLRRNRPPEAKAPQAPPAESEAAVAEAEPATAETETAASESAETTPEQTETAPAAPETAIEKAPPEEPENNAPILAEAENKEQPDKKPAPEEK